MSSLVQCKRPVCSQGSQAAGRLHGPSTSWARGRRSTNLLPAALAGDRAKRSSIAPPVLTAADAAPAEPTRNGKDQHNNSTMRAVHSLSVQQQPEGDTDQDKQMAALSLAVSLGGGLLLGHLGLGADEALPLAVQELSASLGWSYVLAWSISFYPQVIDNAQRRSVEGLSADYLVYSLLGYAAYAAYTAALHFNPGVQAAYMAAHAGSPPDVQLTDCLFAGHALLVTLFTLYQSWLYRGNISSGSSSSSPLATSRLCNATAVAVFAAVLAYSGHIGSTCDLGDCDAWLPLLYLLGFIKVSMTLIKYTPQALLNMQRASTQGWNINNVLLDLSGGLLSLAQVALNAAARGDLTVITGNPAKMGISLLSVAFDVLFILQHYVWYSGSSSTGSSNGAASEQGAAPTKQQQQPAAAVGSSGSCDGSSNLRQPGGRRLVAVAVRAASGVARGMKGFRG